MNFALNGETISFYVNVNVHVAVITLLLADNAFSLLVSASDVNRSWLVETISIVNCKQLNSGKNEVDNI